MGGKGGGGWRRKTRPDEDFETCFLNFLLIEMKKLEKLDFFLIKKKKSEIFFSRGQQTIEKACHVPLTCLTMVRFFSK